MLGVSSTSVTLTWEQVADTDYAWYANFENGTSGGGKTFENSVRAVRLGQKVER